jgi:hypothetical protein
LNIDTLGVNNTSTTNASTPGSLSGGGSRRAEAYNGANPDIVEMRVQVDF